MPFFKTHRHSPLKAAIARLQRHAGVCDLLGYVVCLTANSVLHKDGGISLYYRYEPPDCLTANDSEWDYHAATWQQALSLLGDGWMVETHVQSQANTTTQPARVFPEVVSALIDDERRQHFSHAEYYQTTMTICLTYKSPRLIERRLRRFVVNTTEKIDAGFDPLVQFVCNKADEVVQILSRSYAIRSLHGDELTTFLSQCLIGHTHNVTQPKQGYFLNVLLSSDDFIAGFAPRMGERHIRVLAIDGLPAQSHPGMLADLCYFPAPYRWTNRFICLDQQTANVYLKRATRHWSSQAIGVVGVLKESMGMPVRLRQDAEQTAEAMRCAQAANQSGAITLGFYNSNIVLMEKDLAQLDTLSDAFVEYIQQRNFRVRRETVNATEAFLGSLPGHGGYNVRQGLIDSGYVSHALPTSALYTGQPQAPCPLNGYQTQSALLVTHTRGLRPFHLNCHQGDVGHTLIAGPTGMGKTTLVGMLLAAHRQYPGSRIIVLDKDHSNKWIIQALGGQYYDLGQQDAQFAPLVGLGEPSSPRFELALAWLIDIITVQGVDVTPQRQQILRDALCRLIHEPRDDQSLDHLVIQDPLCRDAIRSFNQGQRHWLLNGREALCTHADIVGFETTALLQTEGSQHDLAIPVLKALFNALQMAFQDFRPTVLVLEEGWLYLRHPVFRRQLEDWFNTCRKANVSVWLITPNLEHITSTQAAPIVLNACQTRLFLPNPALKNAPVQQQAYQAVGLTAEQIALLIDAQPKRDVFYWSAAGQQWLQVTLLPLAKAFIGLSDKADIAAFTAQFNQTSPQWILAWLRRCGLTDWAQYACQQYFGGSI